MKNFLFLTLLLITLISCSKDNDAPGNSLLVGKWYTYQLDEIQYIGNEPALGCPGKITGTSDEEKWNSFFKNYNGKNSVAGCEYEKSVEFKSDGTVWADGTKFANYSLSSDKKTLQFRNIDADGSNYDEDVEVQGIEGTVMMTTTSPLLSGTLGPLNDFAVNTFFVKR